jgi:protein-S-isoprenylcysteine O-methyltransferase Ste14
VRCESGRSDALKRYCEAVEQVALALWGLFGLVALVLPAALQVARSGSTGLEGVSGKPGSIEWFAGVGFVLAIALGVCSPLLAETAGVEPIGALDRSAVHAAGIALFALGLIATVASQQWMGRSWRVGVDESERTELVTRGPFALVRNPIYTAMTMVLAGLALMVPSVASLASLVVLVASLEAQTRLVEEPYLVRMHGEAYLRYARRVGRFVPGVGRLR